MANTKFTFLKPTLLAKHQGLSYHDVPPGMSCTSIGDRYGWYISISWYVPPYRVGASVHIIPIADWYASMDW